MWTAAVISTPMALQEFICSSSSGGKQKWPKIFKNSQNWFLQKEYPSNVGCSSDFNAHGTSRVHLVIIIRPFFHCSNVLTKSGIFVIFWSFWLIHIEFRLIVGCSSDFNAHGTSRVHLVIIIRPFCQLSDEIWYFWNFLVILATSERILAHCRLQQ